MSGFGSFMEGFSGGAKSMSDLQDARELRRARKAIRHKTEMDIEGENYQRGLEEGGLGTNPLEGDTTPYLMRFGEGLKALKDKVTRREALPTVNPDLAGLYQEQNPLFDEASNPTLGQGLDDFSYADASRGGVGAPPEGYGDWVEDPPTDSKRTKYNPDSPEEIKRRQSAPRTSSKPPDAVNDTTAPKTAIPEGPPKGKWAARAGRVASGVKGTAALGASIGGIASVAENTMDANGKLEDYYRRIGRDPARAGDYRPVEHAAMRGMGFLQDMGKGVTSWIPGLNDALHVSDNGPQARTAPAPTAAIPEDKVAPTGRTPGGPGPSKRPTAPPPTGTMGPPKPAIPTAPAQQDPMAGFDASQFKPEQVPRMSTAEWNDHETKLRRSYIAAGKSYAEASDLAEAQVMNQQRRGFLHFGQQAAALYESGNLQGAASAVTAAFQNLPSQTDVNVVVHNGHLVAYGVDEDTGEQVGQPWVLNGQRLQDILRNFADPKVWGDYALNSRKLDQGERALGQADTELEQGWRKLDIMEQGVGAEQTRADASMIAALDGGSGGIGPKDTARAASRIETGAYEVARLSPDEDIDQGELAIALKSIAMQQYMRSRGTMEPETIYEKLKEIVKRPGGAAYLLSGGRSQ